MPSCSRTSSFTFVATAGPSQDRLPDVEPKPVPVA